VELIRYKPGEAIRWLQIGAEDFKKDAQRKGKSVIRREGERTIQRDVKEVAGAIWGMGKGALTDLIHRQAEATEYILHEEMFELVSPGQIRSIKYSVVKAIRVKGDKVTVILDRGSLTIKPHAYILSGRIKVPVGWSRNGMEVPFEVLIDELSGRCDVDIEQAA
jgi:hypothetical protein